MSEKAPAPKVYGPMGEITGNAAIANELAEIRRLLGVLVDRFPVLTVTPPAAAGPVIVPLTAGADAVPLHFDNTVPRP